MISSLLDSKKWQLYNKIDSPAHQIFIAKHITGTKKIFLYQTIEDAVIKPPINFIPKLRTVNDHMAADFVLVPHPWISIRRNKDYLNYLFELGRDVPLIIFNTDDLSPKCTLPNCLEIRTFLHPREDAFRKIIFPYPSKSIKSPIRTWRTIPQISFLGYLPKFSFGSLTSRSRSFFKAPIQSSVYINRKIATVRLNNLENDFKVVNITRPYFSLTIANKNLELDLNEYYLSLRESDYVVCPRGFGNTSIRFYETLSSGATPILINSGSQLPELETNSFWGTNILQVELLSNWKSKIIEDWNYLGQEDNYLRRQIKNQEIYINELDLERYALKFFKNYTKYK